MEHVCAKYVIAVTNVRDLIFLIMLVSVNWKKWPDKTISAWDNDLQKEIDFSFSLCNVSGISSVFYFVAIVSLIQLLICIVSEYQRLKQPSFLRACRLTTQKLLYFVVFIAALLRGAYFTTPVSFISSFAHILILVLTKKSTFLLQEVLQPVWASNLMSAYYPLLMTCASLVVCLWAEVSTTLIYLSFPSMSRMNELSDCSFLFHFSFEIK